MNLSFFALQKGDHDPFKSGKSIIIYRYDVQLEEMDLGTWQKLAYKIQLVKKNKYISK